MLWRTGPDGSVEVGLIHRPRYDDWSHPKGKLDAGETDAEAAVREVREETGHEGGLGVSLGEISYPQERKGRRARKVVAYWAMEAAGGKFVPGEEVDELCWLGLDEARATLTYERDRQLLDRAAAAIGRGD